MPKASLSSRYWALLLELVRHVGPFLGLTLGQVKFLETAYASSIRQQSVVVKLDDSFTAASALRRLGLLLPTPSGLYVVNIPGLVRFYQKLAACRGTTRCVDVENLRVAVERFFTAKQYPLADLSVPVPPLGPRKSVKVGRAEPVFRQLLGNQSTVYKWRLLDAAMTVAVDYLKTKAEFYTFMRCLNMTLERDALVCPGFSLERLMNGHRKRGSLGLPIGERSLKAAARKLELLGLISITRKRPNHKTGRLTLNVLGITAAHASDHRGVRSLELYYTTYNLLDRLNREDDFEQIFGRPISEYLGEAIYTYRDLHVAVHKALNSYHRRIRVNGGWSDGSCPLASATHDHGTDDSPSFGIFIDTGGAILYNCFACGDGGARPISHLFNAMAQELGEFPIKARRTCLSVSQLIRLKGVTVPLECREAIALSEDVFKDYPLLTRYTKGSTGYLKKYLRGRGVTDGAYEHFNVRYMTAMGSDAVPKTLVTEFTNCDGTVSALRLRSVAAKDTKDHRGFTTLGSLGSSMFGLAQADTSRALLVVEGEIDAECCHSFGFKNVVATGGATRSIDALVGVLRLWSHHKVYLGLDCDKAGQETQDKLIDLLKLDAPHLYRVVWSDIKSAAPFRTKYGQRQTCKDPGDIKARSDFWKVIKNAEYVGPVRGTRRSGLSG
ncbi:MAG: toprim domain-containing protein [Desulfomonilaceae bacterium]